MLSARQPIAGQNERNNAHDVKPLILHRFSGPAQGKTAEDQNQFSYYNLFSESRLNKKTTRGKDNDII